MLSLAVLLVLTLIGLYWWRFEVWSDASCAKALLAALLPLIVLQVPASRLEREPVAQTQDPVFLAIACDVSLSMGAAPDPRLAPGMPARLERARSKLLAVLEALEATDAQVVTSVTAFTSSSNTLLAWDDDPVQVREVVEHVLSTDLSTEHGSDLTAALAGAITLFEALPEQEGSHAQRRVLIIVSDGEQTQDNADLTAELAFLRSLDVQVVALHAGSRDLPEGLHQYDESGAFVNFDRVGGRTYSVPDPDVMRRLAGDGPDGGLFVDAADSGAARAIVRFVGLRPSGAASGPLYIALASLIWALSMMVLVRLCW